MFSPGFFVTCFSHSYSFNYIGSLFSIDQNSFVQPLYPLRQYWKGWYVHLPFLIQTLVMPLRDWNSYIYLKVLLNNYVRVRKGGHFTKAFSLDCERIDSPHQRVGMGMGEIKSLPTISWHHSRPQRTGTEDEDDTNTPQRTAQRR